MTPYDVSAEIGRGLLAQLPSALLGALTTTALTAFSRKRRRSRAQTEEDTDSNSQGASNCSTGGFAGTVSSGRKTSEPVVPRAAWRHDRLDPLRLDDARQRTSGPDHFDLTAADVASTYRALRKAFEDRKNQPGAADFYYGEMEMRRCDHLSTPGRPGPWWGERALLWAYWLLSGYGQRASRALAWLGVTVAASVLTLMGWGLPTQAPIATASGTLTPNTITLVAGAPDTHIAGNPWTWPRAWRALHVAVNSVVFRTSGQNLTPVGDAIDWRPGSSSPRSSPWSSSRSANGSSGSRPLRS